MHLLLFLFPLASIFSANKAVDIDKYRAYPKVEEVAKSFDAQNTVSIDKNTYLCLAKKPGGWYVDRRYKIGDATVKEILFWSSETKSYNKNWKQTDLDYPGFEAAEQELEKIYKFYFSYDFTHSIYFGYEKYADDVIADLEGGNNLNDTLLESLARAYSKKNKEVMEPLFLPSDWNKSHNTMSESQVVEYCLWADKDIDTYKRLLALNPTYEAFYELVRTKLANEYVFLYSTLCKNNRPKEAAKYLPDDIYDPLMLAFAKNLLTGVEKNGILFTVGDNDTFPLWYVQDKLGFRTDVAVVATSLLSVPDWIFYWKKKYNLQLSISETLYRDTLTDFIVTNSSNESPVSFNEVIKKMEKKDSSVFETSNGYAVLSMTAKKISLSKPGSTSKPLIADFGTDSYFYKNDLAIMDVISSNLGLHSCYFSTLISPSGAIKAIQKNLLTEGLVKKIVPGENTGTEFNGEYFNVPLLEKNLETVYTYGITKGKPLECVFIADYYNFLFYDIISIDVQKKDKVKTKKHLDLWQTSVPVEFVSNPKMLDFMARTLYDNGDKEKSHTIYLLNIELIRNDKDVYEYYSNMNLLETYSNASEKHYFEDVGKAAEALKGTLKRE